MIFSVWQLYAIARPSVCHPSAPRASRSANVPTFVVPRTRTKLGDRTFAAAGPRIWNSLPGQLRQTETLTTFKRQLKTFLFSD